ncbi:hypothetical protein [Treponema pectinovorum]|uniref:hypothetical protein n=1 Tax=Treponema pectinovorum TaxID=164 RepID=UPI00164CF06F|nr:hypothetical protein [Treponema pectinovorum]
MSKSVNKLIYFYTGRLFAPLCSAKIGLFGVPLTLHWRSQRFAPLLSLPLWARRRDAGLQVDPAAHGCADTSIADSFVKKLSVQENHGRFS